jgi:hypothetical protein
LLLFLTSISLTPFFTLGFTGVETGVIKEDTFVWETLALVGQIQSNSY